MFFFSKILVDVCLTLKPPHLKAHGQEDQVRLREKLSLGLRFCLDGHCSANAAYFLIFSEVSSYDDVIFKVIS